MCVDYIRGNTSERSLCQPLTQSLVLAWVICCMNSPLIICHTFSALDTPFLQSMTVPFFVLHKYRMKVIDDSTYKLAIVSDESVFSWISLGICLICAGLSAAMYLNGSYTKNEERFIGLLCGAGIFLTSGVAVYERSRFVFDKIRKELIWERSRIFSKKGGVVPFMDLKEIVMQSMGNPANPSRRLSIITVRGEQLPLTSAYAPGTGKLYEDLQQRIQRILGGDG